MKTKIHLPGCASMGRIEELASSIDYRTPDWVSYIVAIEGTETSALDAVMADTQHFSGLLRSTAFSTANDGKIEDEDGKVHDVEYLMDEAAERLDSAHQEWLEHETRGPLLSKDELAQLSMILMTYCEDCDSDDGTGNEVDALWAKIRGAKA